MIDPLIVKAIKKADQVRIQLGLDMIEPINIFDACIELGLTVRFIDVNMEGMFISQQNKLYPTILISNQRPLPRRYFTCAHELGHYIFEHGNRVDVLADEATKPLSNNREEFLVDTFAGALLMPIEGIEAEFRKRGWDIKKVNPIQLCIICSTFNVGYATLIIHCRANKLITNEKANVLLKQEPAKILQSILGSDAPKSYFKIIDDCSSQSLIDLEVSNYLFLPQNIQIEGKHLMKYRETSVGTVYVAKHPGVIRVSSPDNSNTYFVRIQSSGYEGLAEYRHLENIPD